MLEGFVSDMICTSISLVLLYSRTVVIIITVEPNIEASRLDGIFSAQHYDEAYDINASS